MAEKRELKIRALIPESETALGKTLEERGLEVKSYLSLRTVAQQGEAVEGLAADERLLLFFPVGAPSRLSTSNHLPADHSDIAREERKPLQAILFAQVLLGRLERRLATDHRNRIALVLMVSRDSDLESHIPPLAHILLKPFDTTEIRALIDNCVVDFETTFYETRQQFQEALDLEMSSFDIDIDDDFPSADSLPLKPVTQGESAIAPLDSIATPVEFSQPIVQVTHPETQALYQPAYLESGAGNASDAKSNAGQVMNATFMADGSFEMTQDEPSRALSESLDPANSPIKIQPVYSEGALPSEPSGSAKILIADGASYKGSVDMRVSERQQALRLEDREQVIQILARYSMPLDLVRFSQPKEGFDPHGRFLFQNHEPNHEIIASSDWTTSRGLEKSAEVLGIQSLMVFQDIAQSAARSHSGRKFEPVTLHLGPGDGKIMNEFATVESHRKNGNYKPTRHVGMARSLLFGLSDLLDRSMVTGLPDSSTLALRKFNQRITLLLQREFGRSGRMKINLNLPEDQIRLKDYLVRLAKNPETLGYANGVRETLSTTGKYADDKPDLISDEEVQCFAEYTADPKAFFEKYYASFFHPESQQDLNALLNLEKSDILFGDFKDMPKLLEGAGAFVTFAYSVKGFSHLEDYDYGVALNEVAARLVPGGILVDDGVVESYTWHQRIEPLRDVQRNLGRDYRFYLIGNEERPISVLVQRGVRNHKGDHCDFTLQEITNNCSGSKVVSLKNYETVWPEAALRNKITKHIKDQLLHGLVRGIADNSLRLECAQTWRQTCLKEIDPLFTDMFKAHVREWREEKGGRSGHIKRIDRQKLSNNKHFDAIFKRFESERGEPLDRFIQSLLLRLYRERREGSRSGKESRKEGGSE